MRTFSIHILEVVGRGLSRMGVIIETDFEEIKKLNIFVFSKNRNKSEYFIYNEKI